MQHLKVSCAVRPIYGLLGAKGLIHTIMVRLEACSSSYHLIPALHKYLLTYELYWIIFLGTLLSFIPYTWLNYLCQ
jgi:hypothetical protein